MVRKFFSKKKQEEEKQKFKPQKRKTSGLNPNQEESKFDTK